VRSIPVVAGRWREMLSELIAVESGLSHVGGHSRQNHNNDHDCALLEERGGFLIAVSMGGIINAMALHAKLVSQNENGRLQGDGERWSFPEIVSTVAVVTNIAFRTLSINGGFVRCDRPSKHL